MTEAQLLKIIDNGLDLNSFIILERISEGKPTSQLMERLKWCEGVLFFKNYLVKGKITPEGKKFLAEIIGKGKTIEELAKDYCDIFPDVKLPSGKYFKAEPKDVVDRLKAFVKEYKYEYDTILEAARRYVDHAENAEYQFIRTSVFFIHKKGEGSDLANWCRDIVNGDKSVSKSRYTLL